MLRVTNIFVCRESWATVIILCCFACSNTNVCQSDMGLGKTVQTISFISAILVERKKPVFAFKLGDKTVPTEEEKQKFQPVLVIAPSGVVMNWEREFQNWGKLMGRTFAVHRYMGPQRDRIQIYSYF